MAGEDLGAIDEDVRFDWAGAEALIEAFEPMAYDIESRQAERATAAEGALVDWQGQARQLFVERFGVGAADAIQLEYSDAR